MLQFPNNPGSYSVRSTLPRSFSHVGGAKGRSRKLSVTWLDRRLVTPSIEKRAKSRRLLTPETACPHFSHQTANNALVESAKRLVRREVSPGGTALRTIDAAGFGLGKALRNLVGDSCLKLPVEFVDRHEIFVQWIPAAPRNPVNPFTKFGNCCEVFRPEVING